ncbi:AAA family ATPase [Anaerobium acetethylicum]|uniref:Predicted ATP-binding protein involved in virulence n=1 Tax=Anaerobium acetethylicum TaxID=1619234 RepID=A0A1D3TUH9_9FIRM|nr:AAA family ATPase [Anaerobium acetethylicum]SCP97740.1 Predicted ATP-binding protein involved in virulence [Anaerobium acetethylicum]
MKINNLKIKNFRCFENLNISLQSDYTVLIGINGSGKSSILDSISIALGSYLTGYDKIKANGIHADDAHYKMYEMGSNIERQGQYPVEVYVDANVDNQEMSWKRTLNGEGRRTTYGDAKNIIAYAQQLQSKVRAGDKNCILPIIAYYGTGILWMQKKEKRIIIGKNKKTETSRISGYIDCLDVASNEKLMMKWFEKMTYIQLQDGEMVPELEAVKKAMKQCFMSSDENILDAKFSFDVKSNEIEILIFKKNGIKEKLPMKSLSDGIKGAVSMIADIAYRMAMLNPHLFDNVLQTPGVVLIDEVDIHLHPAWQKKIVSDLVSTFPNVQFVVTTHSPSVIANVPKEHILILDNYEVHLPQNTTYGRDVSAILREIMYADVRPKEVSEMIKKFYDAIDEDDIEQAKKLLDNMKTILGDLDSEVVQAQVYLDVQEV